MNKWTLFSLVLLIAGLTTYHFVVTPDEKPQEVMLLESSNPACTPVDSPCSARDQQRTVTLHFPNKVKYLQPFQMQVSVQGLTPQEIEKIIVDFKMIGMDMGLNRFTLSPGAAKDNSATYQGEAILPVCVSGRVDWVANIEVMTTNKIYQADFTFKVSK